MLDDEGDEVTYDILEDEKEEIAYSNPNEYPVLVSDKEFEKLLFSSGGATVEVSAELDPNPNCPLCAEGDKENHTHELLFLLSGTVFRVVKLSSE